MSEGFDLWIALIVSIGLVVFSSILFAMSKKYRAKKANKAKLIIFIWAVLAVYSINCTIAGQYWDQQIKDSQTETNTTEKENTAYLAQQYQQNIEELKKESAELARQKSESIKNLSDRYDYKNTVAAVEKRQSEIKAEIKEYEKEIKKIIDGNKISLKRTEDIKILENIYSFYNAKNPKLIQFIFQGVLSIFIELMAPLALMFFIDLKPKEFKIVKKTITADPVSIYPETVKNFTILAFMNIENEVSKALLSTQEIHILSKKRGIYMTEKEIDRIYKTAEKKELVKKSGAGYIPASEYIDADYFYEKIAEGLPAEKSIANNADNVV
jgi:hypothetical protein